MRSHDNLSFLAAAIISPVILLTCDPNPTKFFCVQVKQKALVIWGENDQIIDSKLSVVRLLEFLIY